MSSTFSVAFPPLATAKEAQRDCVMLGVRAIEARLVISTAKLLEENPKKVLSA